MSMYIFITSLLTPIYNILKTFRENYNSLFQKTLTKLQKTILSVLNIPIEILTT